MCFLISTGVLGVFLICMEAIVRLRSLDDEIKSTIQEITHMINEKVEKRFDYTCVIYFYEKHNLKKNS